MESISNDYIFIMMIASFMSGMIVYKFAYGRMSKSEKKAILKSSEDFYDTVSSLKHNDTEKNLLRSAGFRFVNDLDLSEVAVINLSSRNGEKIANSKTIIRICREVLSGSELSDAKN